MKHEVTYVTSCIDIDRANLKDEHAAFRRYFNAYESGYRQNLETYLPLVSFNSIDYHKFWIPSHRTQDNFLSIPWTKQTLMDNIIDKEVFNKQFDNSKVYKNGVVHLVRGYGPIAFMKYFMIKKAMELNPFESDYFVWIDCQCMAAMNYDFRKEDNAKLFSSRMAKKLSHKKFLLFKHPGCNISTMWKIGANVFEGIKGTPEYTQIVFGQFWGGHKDILNELYEPYWEIYRKCLDTFIPTEEVLFNLLTMFRPECFDSHFIHLHGGGVNYKQKMFDYVFNASS